MSTAVVGVVALTRRKDEVSMIGRSSGIHWYE
jgi:hypothetical protein